jgi:hypothetical protein
MNIQFVTAIYSNLYGTKFGGRQSRYWHYRYSLLSLLKMTKADFLCYTCEEEIEDLENFFYKDNLILPERLKFKTFDLSSGPHQDLIEKYKDFEDVKTSMRCSELQYLKFYWLSLSLQDDYDYIYWIDAGLSHAGLFPIKHLSMQQKKNESLGYDLRDYFECHLFNNNLLDSIINFTEDKIFAINGEIIERRAPEKFFIKEIDSKHVIGGIFGGKKLLIKKLVEAFDYYVREIINDAQYLCLEEQVLTVIVNQNRNLFNTKNFTLWWHEDSAIAGFTDNPEIMKNHKSFYKIIEELLDIK